MERRVADRARRINIYLSWYDLNFIKSTGVAASRACQGVTMRHNHCFFKGGHAKETDSDELSRLQGIHSGLHFSPGKRVDSMPAGPHTVHAAATVESSRILQIVIGWEIRDCICPTARVQLRSPYPLDRQQTTPRVG